MNAVVAVVLLVVQQTFAAPEPVLPRALVQLGDPLLQGYEVLVGQLDIAVGEQTLIGQAGGAAPDVDGIDRIAFEAVLEPVTQPTTGTEQDDEHEDAGEHAHAGQEGAQLVPGDVVQHLPPLLPIEHGVSDDRRGHRPARRRWCFRSGHPSGGSPAAFGRLRRSRVSRSPRYGPCRG